MRSLLLIAGLIISTLALGQTQYIGVPGNTVETRGRHKVDSAFTANDSIKAPNLKTKSLDTGTYKPIGMSVTGNFARQDYWFDPYSFLRMIVGPIDLVTPHKRNDAPSIVKLPDGTYLAAWSVFTTTNTADVAPSVIYASKSPDGVHWGTPYQIVPVVAGLNSSTPSLYVRSNGDVLCFFNIKYNTAQLTSTLAYSKSTNSGTTFSFQDSLIKSANDYFYTKSDAVERSPGTGRLFLPFGKITNRGLAYFIGGFMYSDDDGTTWTKSSQVFVSPDSVVNEPGMYVCYRFPNTATSGEFTRFYYTTQSKGTVYAYQSIDNSSTWTSYFYDMGLLSPYAQPALKVFDNGQRAVALVNHITGAATQAGQRKSLDIVVSENEGTINDVNNALSLGNQWKTVEPLVFADSGYTVFEPSILIDSARRIAIIGISRFDSAFTVASFETIKLPLSRLMGDARQSWGTLNIGVSSPEIVANASRLVGLYNRTNGSADSYCYFGTLSGSPTDGNWYLNVKEHAGTASGFGVLTAPGTDADAAYYSALLWVNGTVTNMPLFKTSNAGSVKFSIGPTGQTSIGNATRAAWLTIAAGVASANGAPIKLTSGTNLTTPENGAIEYDGTNFYATPSGTVRQTILLQNTSVSSATSLTLAVTVTSYVFSGSSTTTWTLPALSGNTNKIYFIKNRGTAAITLNTAGSDNLYTTSSVTSLTINPGEGYHLINDGSFWNVL